MIKEQLKFEKEKNNNIENELKQYIKENLHMAETIAINKCNYEALEHDYKKLLLI